ncbi:MAG: hypothetical protein FWG36_04085 [Oscillospiraceae bacterium]|nr:hypothetical protein [Oscillospiraceae bacterium]
MKREIFKKTALGVLKDSIGTLVLTLVILGMVLFGLYQAEQSVRSESIRVLEEGILRAAVKCYTVEGSYPESIAYIEDNYGVYIDRTKYVVHYDIFASNLLPDITVIDLRNR